MVRPAAWTTSSTNHHHGSITITPVTPEEQVIPASNVAVTAVHLIEAFSGSEGATKVIYRTTSMTCVAVPGDAISEVPEAGNKASKSSPTSTATSFEYSCVKPVITSRDFDINTLNEPKCRWYHIIVVRCIGCTVRSYHQLPLFFIQLAL